MSAFTIQYGKEKDSKHRLGPRNSVGFGQAVFLRPGKGSDDPFFSLVREKVGSSSTCNNFIMLCGTIEIKELGNAYHHGGPESFISGAWASFKGGSIGFLFVTAL
jgi:hypothetical protein